MKTKRIILSLIITIIVGTFILSGCEEVLDPDFVSPEDSLAAITAVEAANASMETLMDAMYNAEPDSVQDLLNILDYSEPYALYVEAHELNPKNSDANFGLALTGFLMLSQDNQLQDMLVRWESYFNVHDESETHLEPTSGFTLPLSVDGIRIPLTPIIGTPVALSKMSMEDVPQFSEFQSLVESLFLPVIEASIEALDAVDDSSDFVFLISPSMQGDFEAEPLELDLTEVYALEMGLYGLKSVLRAVLAYNFDFVSYDSLGIMTELSQGSAFATLKSGGAANLGIALESAQMAVTKALASLDFLEAETDDQSNDIIQSTDNIDMMEIRASVMDAQSTLSEPTLIHYDYWEDIYDDNGYWIDETFVEDSITVDISQFFLNPINDFKAMLPPYTMHTATYNDYAYHNVSEHVHHEEVSVTVAGLDNTPLSVTLTYSNNDYAPILEAWVNIGGLGYNLSTANQDDVPNSVWNLYDEFQSLVAQYSDELYSYPYISFYWSGTATTGTSLIIDGDFYISYEEISSSHVEPSPTWDAVTYSDWLLAWPDPTMNGIFPDLDAAGIANFMGFDESNWQDFNN